MLRHEATLASGKLTRIGNGGQLIHMEVIMSRRQARRGKNQASLQTGKRHCSARRKHLAKRQKMRIYSLARLPKPQVADLTVHADANRIKRTHRIGGISTLVF